MIQKNKSVTEMHGLMNGFVFYFTRFLGSCMWLSRRDSILIASSG